MVEVDDQDQAGLFAVVQDLVLEAVVNDRPLEGNIKTSNGIVAILHVLHYLARFPSDSPVSDPHMNVALLGDDKPQVGPEPGVGGPGVGGDDGAGLHQGEGRLALGTA